MSFNISPRQTGFTRPCAECEDLREELAYLRSELGMADEATCISDFKMIHGLTRMQSMLLMALYRAGGRVLTVYQLNEILGSESSDIAAIRTQICNLKRRIGKDTIISAREVGYRITPQGRAVVDALRANQPLIATEEK